MGACSKILCRTCHPGLPAVYHLIAKGKLVPVPFTDLKWSWVPSRMERSAFSPSLCSYPLGTKVDVSVATVMLNGVPCESNFFKFWICPLLRGLTPKCMRMVRRPQSCLDVGPYCVLPTYSPYLFLQTCFQSSALILFQWRKTLKPAKPCKDSEFQSFYLRHTSCSVKAQVKTTTAPTCIYKRHKLPSTTFLKVSLIKRNILYSNKAGVCGGINQLSEVCKAQCMLRAQRTSAQRN